METVKNPQVTAEQPTRNGKPTKNDGKIHHAIKIHYFDWAIFQFAKVKDPKGLVTVAGKNQVLGSEETLAEYNAHMSRSTQRLNDASQHHTYHTPQP